MFLYWISYENWKKSNRITNSLFRAKYTYPNLSQFLILYLLMINNKLFISLRFDKKFGIESCKYLILKI